MYDRTSVVCRSILLHAATHTHTKGGLPYLVVMYLGCCTLQTRHSHSHSSVETQRQGAHLAAEISFRWAFSWCRPGKAWQAVGEGERLEISGRTVRADPTHPDPCVCRVRTVPRPSFPAHAQHALHACFHSRLPVPFPIHRRRLTGTPHLEAGRDPHTHITSYPRRREPNNVESMDAVNAPCCWYLGASNTCR